MTATYAQSHSQGGIYLDHHATTPVDHRVARVMLEMMTETFGNANSLDHVYGEQAAAAVEAATNCVAELLSAEVSDVFYTSGSTHAIELAFANAVGRAMGRTLRVALSRVEHAAVLDVAKRAERLGLASIRWLDVSSDGSINLDQVQRLLSDVDLLCLMAANNEVGTIYPIQQVYQLARSSGVAMLVDATQAVGKVKLDLSQVPVDYLVFSGHKIYGPKGIGALVSPVYRVEDNFGWAGSHSATPNVPGIVGLGMACRLVSEEGDAEVRRLQALGQLMLTELKSMVPNIVFNGCDNRLAGNLHLSALGAPNDAVVARLRGQVAISTGAACMSGAHGPSHVLQAMGLSQAVQDSALRIGLGRRTTRDNVLEAARLIASAIASVRMSLERQHA